MRQILLVFISLALPSAATLIGAEQDSGASDLSAARLKLMRDRAQQIQFNGIKLTAKRVQPQPLFRYDDLARGYEDGTVWRLGEKGRPLAIVTTELHPRYGAQGTNQSNPKVVYDLLSFSTTPFRARSTDITWSPMKPAVEIKELPCRLQPAANASKRLLQFKRLARQFKAIQHVNETGTVDQQLVLRLLPQNIDRYQPVDDDNKPLSPNADGVIFLFVAGRMPGVLLALETDGKSWQYGVGRLSGPSRLTLSYEEELMWAVPPSFGNSTAGYFATNAAANLPQAKD